MNKMVFLLLSVFIAHSKCSAASEFFSKSLIDRISSALEYNNMTMPVELTPETQNKREAKELDALRSMERVLIDLYDNIPRTRPLGQKFLNDNAELYYVYDEMLKAAGTIGTRKYKSRIVNVISKILALKYFNSENTEIELRRFELTDSVKDSIRTELNNVLQQLPSVNLDLSLKLYFETKGIINLFGYYFKHSLPRDNLMTICETLINDLTRLNKLDECQSKALANLLALKYLTHEAALSEGLNLKHRPQHPLTLDENAFRAELTEIFSGEFLQKINKHYSHRVWSGHAQKDAPTATPTQARQRAREQAQAMEMRNGVCPIVSKTITNCEQEKEGVAKEFGTNNQLTYTFIKPVAVEQMRAIVISIYSGYTEDWKALSGTLSLPDSTVGRIGLNLPDSKSSVFQSDQLNPVHFKDTHARYLRLVSDFVKVIKAQYPNMKIFLHGGSFGGFFVSSYALLQSVGLDPSNLEKVYHDFSKDAFITNFDHVGIEPIDGAISYSGASYHIQEITKELGWSRYLSVPVFYHWNFDDDRVDFLSALQSIDPPLGEQLNEKIKLSINRRGAMPFLTENELSDAKENLRFQSALDSREVSTTRGHFNGNNINLPHQVLDFIDTGVNAVSSSLHQVRERRLHHISKKTAGADEMINPKDLQQFLSNMAKPINLSLTEEEKRQVEILKDFKKRGFLKIDETNDLDINSIIFRMREVKLPVPLDLLLSRFLYSFSYPEGMVSFEILEKEIDKKHAFRELKELFAEYKGKSEYFLMIEKLKDYPQFKHIYDSWEAEFASESLRLYCFEKLKYYKKLLEAATTKDLWQEARKKVSLMKTAVRNWRTLDKNVRAAGATEEVVGNPLP